MEGMQASHRLSVAAFCTDFALYLLMLSLPFRVLDLGGSAAQLGWIPVLYAGPYSLVAALAGHVSDRWPRRGPIRFGLAVAMLGAASLIRANSLTSIFSSVPLVGVGLGFFWPSLQAGFSEVQQGRNLMKMVSQFNMSWSAGKGSGMLLGGILLGATGPGVVSALAATSLLIAAAAVPWMDRPADHSAVIEADPIRPPAPRQAAFLKSAWVANGVGFGVVATVNHHYPRIALQHGLDSADVGKLLAAVFLSQTLFFLQSGARRWWHYRTLPLVAVQLVLACVVVGVGWSSGLSSLLPLGVLLGIALGLAYQSSIYYSLDAASARGGQAGIHEAVLGLASAAIPWVGGQLVAPLGDLMPFYLAAACVLAAALHTSIRIRRSDQPAPMVTAP